MSERSEQLEVLWVKAVDGLLSAEEAARLERLLDAQPGLREELELDMNIKATTDAMSARLLAEARIEAPRPTRRTRSVLGAGFFFVFAGLAILFGFGLHVLMTDPEVPNLVRAGVLIAGFGVATLLGYVLRIRLRAVGNDPYEEVDR